MIILCMPKYHFIFTKQNVESLSGVVICLCSGVTPCGKVDVFLKLKFVSVFTGDHVNMLFVMLKPGFEVA